MAKAYWIAAYRSIKDPDAVAAVELDQDGALLRIAVD